MNGVQTSTGKVDVGSCVTTASSCTVIVPFGTVASAQATTVAAAFAFVPTVVPGSPTPSTSTVTIAEAGPDTMVYYSIWGN